MIFEMTIQYRVLDFEKGQAWYTTLIGREPDFIPHQGFAEWELIPGCWLQLAEGEPGVRNGPLRLGVVDLMEMKTQLMTQLEIEDFDIHSRQEVPVKWATFSDPWGNLLGLFEYQDKEEQQERIKTISGV